MDLHRRLLRGCQRWEESLSGLWMWVKEWPAVPVAAEKPDGIQI